MNWVKMIGAGVVAVVAVASNASAAPAAPAWFECAKLEKIGGHYAGGYADKNCTAALPSHEGKWELQPGVGKAKFFKGKGGAATMHIVVPHKGDITVQCQASDVRGAAAAPDRVIGLRLAFRKCKTLGQPCKSPGAKKEEVASTQLAGHLGYIKRSEPTIVGLWLAPEVGGAAGVEAQIECSGLYGATIRGPLIGTISGDVNVISREPTLTWFVAQYLGEPEPGYSPLTNLPSFEDPEEGSGYLTEEQTAVFNEFTWEGAIPAGREAQIPIRGEALMIKA